MAQMTPQQVWEKILEVLERIYEKESYSERRLMNTSSGGPEAFEAIRQICDVWVEHQVEGDETRPLRHLRTIVARYFSKLSRNHMSMVKEEKWHLGKLMAFEALKRHREGLGAEKPAKVRKMKHTLEVCELYEDKEMSAMGAGLSLMKNLTMEKLTLGYGAQQSYLWLVKNGSLEGRLEALTFLNEHEEAVREALKPVQQAFIEAEEKKKKEEAEKKKEEVETDLPAESQSQMAI